MGKVKEMLLKPSQQQSMSGVKHDQEKPRISLIPSSAITGMAKAFTYGSQKYGDNNWKQGMKWSRQLDAAMRHILAFNAGMDNDDESKLNHLYHAMADLAMVIEYQEKGLGKDDRE